MRQVIRTITINNNALMINVVLAVMPTNGRPTSRMAKVNAPTMAQDTFDRIPPDKGMPPKIRATITSISKPVPVESDADPVYPIWNTDATVTQQPMIT